MKRVLIITYYWPPSGGAGVQRWLKFAKYLPEFDWEPVILTVDPEHATYPVTDQSLLHDVDPKLRVIRTRSREWFSVYKKATNAEKIPYGAFASEPDKISFKQKVARFVRGNFFLPDPRKGWNSFAVNAARKLIQEEEIRYIITTGPPHSTHLVGLKLRKTNDIRWIADFRDPWTDIFYYREFYPTLPADIINRRMERKVIQSADHIVTVSPSWARLLANKVPGSKKEVSVITNGYDAEDFVGESSQVPDRTMITYIGTIADSYPFDRFIESFISWTRTNPRGLLRIVGTVSKNQMDKFSRIPEEHFEYVPYVEHAEVIRYLSEASALLISVPQHSSSAGIIPGKLFEYMAARRPIMYLGKESDDAAQLILNSNSGAILDPFSTKQILETLNMF